MNALLVLGGNEIKLDTHIKSADIIICADSGADFVIGQGFMPDVLLGDMDSLNPKILEKCKKERVEVLRYPAEKDMTDGQLAILYAKKKNIDNLDIVCIEGDIDHFLGNLYLLLYAKNLGIKAKAHTEDMTVCLVDDKITIKGKIGDRISIMPAAGTIIVKETSGLYYEITKPLRINFGDTIGLGNYLKDENACILMDDGLAFVFAGNKT